MDKNAVVDPDHFWLQYLGILLDDLYDDIHRGRVNDSMIISYLSHLPIKSAGTYGFLSNEEQKIGFKAMVMSIMSLWDYSKQHGLCEKDISFTDFVYQHTVYKVIEEKYEGKESGWTDIKRILMKYAQEIQEENDQKPGNAYLDEYWKKLHSNTSESK